MSDDAKADKAPESTKAAMVKKKDAPKEYKIVINTQDGVGGNKAVPVTVNGKVWNIPREVETWIPEHVFRVLERSVPTRYTIHEDGKKLLLVSKKIKRFAYSVLETRLAKTA